jgi:hypothetical protein
VPVVPLDWTFFLPPVSYTCWRPHKRLYVNSRANEDYYHKLREISKTCELDLFSNLLHNVRFYVLFFF